MKALFPALLLSFSILSGCCRPQVNVALNHAVSASSNYDANLTAQLLTDGIVLHGTPAFLEVDSSDGPVGRVERENALDGDLKSRNIVTGKEGWLEWRFHGYAVVADKAEVLFQEALKGGRGGPEHLVSVPVSAGAEGALRIGLTFPHEGRWRIKDVVFYKDGQPLGNLLPSAHFTSAWMSEGCADEWVSIDLGEVRRIASVQPHWIYTPDRYEVVVSKDGASWKAFRPGRWRYVKLQLHGDSGERFCLTEIEVLGRGGRKDPAGGWKIQRASFVNAGGAEISAPGFDTEGWLPATVPATVLANYIAAGAVPDPGYGDNWSQISDSFFNGDFWYRREFEWHRGNGRPFLEFDGINWKADVWLNGVQAGRIEGAFIRGRFDVDSLLKDGCNVLAVRTECNAHPGAVKEKTARWTGYNGGVLGADSPTFLASIGWDWMTTVRGRNCGIWNDVRLTEKGAVEVADPLVVSKVNPDGTASLTASVRVKGVENAPGRVTLEGWVGDIRFTREIGAGGEVSFSPDEFPQLKDCRLGLWWPVGYGDPVLHDAGFAVSIDGELSDSLHFKAGIREMTWDSAGGILKLFINGRRFIPQGGNWGFSEHTLRFPAERYDMALDYHRQMNLNMIRNWVGQVADEEFYDACDRYGVMVWQDFWLANPGDGPDPDDEGMFLSNADDWVRRIRRHPCLALYCGRHEGDPPASLDRALREDIVARLHPGMLYISNSADGIVSGHGPYQAVPFTKYYSMQSGKLHSERGIPNVPTWESLQRMLPPQDYWPVGEMWGKHDFTTDGAQSVKTYTRLIEDTWGKPASAREFSYLAQWLNYEGCRAIFESANAAGRMGMVLWMTHSSWPSLVFCTYDYYFEPGGAFFGCRKACEPLHIQYNLQTGAVELVNLCCGDREGLTAQLDIYDGKGQLLGKREARVNAPDDATVSCFAADLPSGEPACLLRLRLLSADGALLSENFYMVPGEGVAQEASLKSLRSLPAAKIRKTVSASGARVTVTLRNEDTLPALLVRLVLKDRKGAEILPCNYSDNYFALLPGEEKQIEIAAPSLRGAPAVELQQLGDFSRSAVDLMTEEVSALSAGQCMLLGESTPGDSLPQTFENGRLVFSDRLRWTSGFFPGTCWYSYLLSGREDVRALAESFTGAMLDVDSYFRDHDIGFQIMCSAGLAYRTTGDERYLPALRRGAELLSSRFSPVTGTIKSWDSSRPVSKVIIDNMMNLELMTFAARQFGVPEWEAMARSHADRTMTNHFREDGSSYHLVEYDLATGEVLVRKTVQGYSDGSSWSRGQSWGLYGYTMMYRETGEKRYLQHAEKIAGYLFPLLEGRPVPAWDFRAPEPLSAQDDASAAAVMASAFVELGSLTRNKALAARCFHQAESILMALSSPRYLAAPGEAGGFLLKHSTGFYMKGSEVDVPLSYADYYFLEALYRYSIVHSAPSLVSLTVMPSALRASRMWSEAVQSRAAFAAARCSSTMSIRPSMTLREPPEPPSSSPRPRTPYTMLSKRKQSVSKSVLESFTAPVLAELTRRTASDNCARATGVFRSSQRAS